MAACVRALQSNPPVFVFSNIWIMHYQVLLYALIKALIHLIKIFFLCNVQQQIRTIRMGILSISIEGPGESLSKLLLPFSGYIDKKDVYLLTNLLQASRVDAFHTQELMVIPAPKNARMCSTMATKLGRLSS